MLFHSPPFLVFFLAYFCVQLLIPRQHRLWLILAGGTVFYAWWNCWLAWLPYSLAMIGWGGAVWISGTDEPIQRRRRLIIALVLLLLPLAVFKYAHFLDTQIVVPMLGLSFWPFELPLPLGISFVTFTMIAYLVDYYRGNYPLERRLHMVAAYMVFFPHLIAGPILRPREIIPQLDHPRRALDINAKLGILLFTAGLAKKVIFGDAVAEVVDRSYTGGPGLTVLDHLFAIYGFALQIYCDFSGYTDMALGLALLLGVRLPGNFKQPYLATSVSDFWRRWHITLSHWLRDYLYIPLGGNRGGALFRARNAMITMVLGGLWHGANWTFVLWGALHGIFIALSGPRGRRSAPLTGWRKILAILVTLHVVILLWIPFRAPDIATAWRILQGLWTLPLGDPAAFVTTHAYVLLLLGLFVLWHPFDRYARLRWAARHMQPALLWPAIMLVWIIAISVSTGSSAKFIYFDF